MPLVIPKPSRCPRLVQDVAGIIVLAAVACGLGWYARSACPDLPAHPDAIPHPTFGLQEFRVHVEAQSALVLDARPAADYAAGHVPHALSLPTQDFDATYARLADQLTRARDALVIVYCSDLWCGLGDELQQRLVTRGFGHVGRFPDGWTAWRNAQLPIATSVSGDLGLATKP